MRFSHVVPQLLRTTFFPKEIWELREALGRERKYALAQTLRNALVAIGCWDMLG